MSLTSTITPEFVSSLKAPTSSFLCPIDKNKYIQFKGFKIRDVESGEVFYNVHDPTEPENFDTFMNGMNDSYRTLHYTFSKNYLKAKHIGTTVEFATCPEAIPNFRMIERHYFKNKLIKSFDFSFGFCIPNSKNTWENVYEVPKISPGLYKEMIQNPEATCSDSFYFIDDKLFMHNKAYFTFK
ncbi:delta subunit of GMP phosphodiesterase [Neocallimastix lanati (nom. inval.)]|uniref:Delta subunit of GMP phosphodiesterase n=1 Tax=Neocallimastix californiae TaxID=1754190 RepID=A0A1Y2DGS7_9FUNG|nr:delta subunit of GMP phosphodiesterase [Neocallimastix sp. JGI-2020a]ORY58326.1 delta subunit of GMP phosphodiesterase [Neocallimastix californiae]|eukprot:ORY58326.1 delta subunit of GMP phosphodiesterase [Neocallimastix californiae]